ncbi:MAG: hypothetical protein RIS21_1210 [Planctomycetota bacterium]|jgi:small subunit ribosomal protein S16
MAVHIRLSRIGRENRPFFRIAVYDSRTRRDGKVLDHLGYYDPINSTGKIWKLDLERLFAWMKKGATPSETIKAHLRAEKIAYGDPTAKRKKNAARRKTRVEARKKTGRTVEKSTFKKPAKKA